MQIIQVCWHGEACSRPRAEAGHQVPAAITPAARGSPALSPPAWCAAGAPARPGTHAGLVAGLVEGERTGGSRIGQAGDVHAAGGRAAVPGKGRAAGDHLRRVPVHEGPVRFQQLAAQRSGAGPVTVGTEELHTRSLSARGTRRRAGAVQSTQFRVLDGMIIESAAAAQIGG
jgi:hypothetical protein